MSLCEFINRKCECICKSNFQMRISSPLSLCSFMFFLCFIYLVVLLVAIKGIARIISYRSPFSMNQYFRRLRARCGAISLKTYDANNEIFQLHVFVSSVKVTGVITISYISLNMEPAAL